MTTAARVRARARASKLRSVGLLRLAFVPLALAWGSLVADGFAAIAIPNSETWHPSNAFVLAGETLSLAWVTVAAVILVRIAGRGERGPAAGPRLVRQLLDAEARERRRLAQALHDDAIQNVLLARQEVADVARGVPHAADRARQALDEVHRQLRDEVFSMHPVGLERAGLAAVLRGLAEAAGRRGGFRARVEIDPAAAGVEDDLLAATARELLANAAAHSRASQVDVTVRADGPRLRLTVADDGAGFVAERLDQALSQGHIGLASLVERLQAVGGEVAIASVSGHGTTVDATIPLSR